MGESGPTKTTGNLRLWCFIISFLCIKVCLCDRGDYVGCYKLVLEDLLNTHSGQSVDVCLSACEQVFYKYAIIGNESTCFCGNVPGLFKLPLEECNTPCPKNETQKCGGTNGASVYDTDVSAPGEPASFDVVNVTETTVRVRWTAPEAYSVITEYLIKATVEETYAEHTLMPLEWRVSNTTFMLELLNLQPGSTYSLTIVASNYDDKGPNKTIEAETIIGTPDPSPPDLKIKERRGDKMLVHIPEAKNVNGPVSMYRIVVSIELYQQGIITETLGNYSYAKEQGLPYYITAELDPDDIKTDFIIGDGHVYNGFYNAPLPLISDIDVSLGVVSEKNHVTKIRYAESTKTFILNINEPEDVSPMVVALGAGIAIGVVLLLIGIGSLIVLRKRIFLSRVQRGSQSMPLSLTEPCIEIENSGFLLDETEKVDYYGNLKRKLWNIPRNLIDIDISCIVGLGSYGKFTRAIIQQHDSQTTGLVQIIADRELERSEKRQMLQELDLLIKSNEHPNVISLIGICETNTTVFVVLQDVKQNLKELLLKSRSVDTQDKRFSTLSESKVLQICIDVARGMDYLHSKKIFHKRLSCRNIVLGDNGVAKVSGFGLAHIRPLHETPDYTRWTAHEMLCHAKFNPKSDVWSIGCLIWETATLGGTLYPDCRTEEVAARVLRGMRPAQPNHIDDELFQLCLQCWQVDPDERPSFSTLVHELLGFSEGPVNGLSFKYYSGFDYDPYIEEYEIIS